jgi:UDP-N-acetylglucosamine acyltransferase
MHKLLYRQGLTLEQARSGIEALASDKPEAAADVDMMSRFLASATRGIAR